MAKTQEELRAYNALKKRESIERQKLNGTYKKLDPEAARMATDKYKAKTKGVYIPFNPDTEKRLREQSKILKLNLSDTIEYLLKNLDKKKKLQAIIKL